LLSRPSGHLSIPPFLLDVKINNKEKKTEPREGIDAPILNIHKNPTTDPIVHSAHQRSPARLDRLDLSLGVGGASESHWQLAAVEELALGGGDGAEVAAGDGAD
jgi:hypothetical protein